MNYLFNHLTPNGHFSGRTAPLTSRRCILYIYSTNIRTEYFKHATHTPFFFFSKCRLFHNATLFGSCIIHILNTDVLKFKRKFQRLKVKNVFKKNNKFRISFLLSLQNFYTISTFIHLFPVPFICGIIATLRPASNLESV
jgi:hypothetical protein